MFREAAEGDAMKIAGSDKWGGGSRWMTVTEDGPLVEISVEGSEGNGTVMLTPDQVMAMIPGLQAAAEAAANTTGIE